MTPDTDKTRVMFVRIHAVAAGPKQNEIVIVALDQQGRVWVSAPPIHDGHFFQVPSPPEPEETA